MGFLIVLLAFIAAAAAIPLLLTYLAARGTEGENHALATAQLSPPISRKAALLRLTVVVLCYLLSGYGFFLGTTILALASLASLSSIGWHSLIAVIYAYAWLCHVKMCIGWMENRYVPRVWPISGLAAIVVSLLLFSSNLVLGPSWISSRPLSISLGILVLEVAFVLPNLVLAIYLAVFHLTRVAPRPESVHL